MRLPGFVAPPQRLAAGGVCLLKRALGISYQVAGGAVVSLGLLHRSLGFAEGALALSELAARLGQFPPCHAAKTRPVDHNI
jgi:hypothetical protein